MDSPDGVDSFFGQVESGSFVSLPLFIKGEVFGVVNVADKETGRQFSNDDLRLLMMMVQRAALSLENYALYEKVYNNLIDTLLSLVSTIEAKDPYTKLHSHRVTQWSVEIAKAMKLPQGDQDIIKSSGILHDIGKIGIPDSILMKPGKLTGEEYQIIKTHPMIGENIVKPLNFLPKEMAVIRHHHERWDGRGYPDGLKGKDTPLVARILAVADAYDAMTSERVYRKAKKEEVAFFEIQRCSGTQFDPAVVESFVGLIESNGGKLTQTLNVTEAPSFIHPRFEGVMHGGLP
jgi:HD-GYP domain-containing protein (c-di-GMP phosphodiesterase class II)